MTSLAAGFVLSLLGTIFLVLGQLTVFACVLFLLAGLKMLIVKTSPLRRRHNHLTHRDRLPHRGMCHLLLKTTMPHLFCKVLQTTQTRTTSLAALTVLMPLADV